MDDLDKFIAERAARNPEFPQMVEDALTRRRFGRWLAQTRKAINGLTQAKIARRMKSTQAIVSRLERGEDVRLSTIQRYAQALGYQVHVELRVRQDTNSRRRETTRVRLAA